MSNSAIRVSGLSKRYRIGVAEERADTLFGQLWNVIASPVRNFRRLRSLSSFSAGEAKGVIWALRDVSFDVQQGAVLGIVGRNGAGKSTILKVLSRITPPSTGEVQIRGRVASLLEVGTGFHPELTGRENVYLNGSLLGMRRREIDSKFAEIVEFSGIDKMIDTPVKHFSSGMAVRLAFSVAAHLDADVLLLDEVLAVGDAEFQKRCLGKMGEVARGGRTVVFVSHNLGAIQSLCTECIVLNDGALLSQGTVESSLERYLSLVEGASGSTLAERTERRGSGDARFLDARLAGATGISENAVLAGQPVDLRLSVELHGERSERVTILMTIYDQMGVGLSHLSNELTGDTLQLHPGLNQVVCRIARVPLRSGQYRVNLGLVVRGEMADHIEDALRVHCVGGDFFGSGKLPGPKGPAFLIEHMWFAGEM